MRKIVRYDAKGLSFDSKTPAIVRPLRGIRNASPKLPKQAEPIRGADILDLMEGIDRTLLGARDAALLALGYISAFRRSELVALDLIRRGPASAFCDPAQSPRPTTTAYSLRRLR